MLKIRKIIMFFIIAVSILIVVILTQHKPFGSRNTSFAIDETADISKIELKTDEEHIILSKDDHGKWLVNGKREARKGSIVFIRKVLTEMQIKSPVSKEMYDGEIIAKNIKPVKVKVFERLRLIKSFYVYKTESTVYGNIMKMGLHAKPFIVNVPGFDVNIGSAFTLHEEFWQPYILFDYKPADIASVKYENKADSSCYEIINDKGKYRFFSSGHRVAGIDSLKVNRYLSYFSMIPFESWAFDLSTEQVTDILKTTPFCKITVMTVKGETKTVLMWRKMNKDVIDTDRLMATMNHNDKIINLRYFDIDPILKKTGYFLVNKIF